MPNHCHLFSMRMLGFFIEDNKKNEYGESFLENLKLKKKLKFLHFFIWYSMHDLIFKHVNNNMIFPKPHKILKHKVH